MNNDELTAYFGPAIEKLIKNILKHTAKDPKETVFLLRFINSCGKAHKTRTQYESKGIHIPAFMIASVTKDCNLDCGGCYAKANSICGRSTRGDMMTEERWEEIFREAADIGVSFILIAGGEPLLRKEVILRAAKFRDVMFPVFTNGTMLDSWYVDLFDKNRNLIPVISLEGGRETTDLRRGAGTFDRITDVMDKLRKARIIFGISVTVTSANLDEVSSGDFIGNLNRIGCRIVFFNEYVPVENNTVSLSLSGRDRNLLEGRLKQLRDEWTDMVLLSFPGDEKITGGCLAAGRGFFHINPYGGAEPCPFSPYSDRDLNNDSLIEVLCSPLFDKLKNMDLDCGEHDGGCALFAHKDEVEKLLEL